MGWKELNGKQIENLLHRCQDQAADLSLLKSVEPYCVNLEDDMDTSPVFVCELQRDSAVLDMLALCKIFQLSVQVFSQSVGIFDRFLSVIKVRPKFLNCISLSCIYLALQVDQSNSAGADFRPPGASDVNRFISASESRCTYSDVVRMSGVIAKKLCLDLNTDYPTLYYAFLQLGEMLNIGNIGAIIDFYATCLCSHDLVVLTPDKMFIAIIGLFLKSDHLIKVKHELKIENDTDLDCATAKVQLAYDDYIRSGRPQKTGRFGVLKRYIFKISQRTGQALMASKSRILALASANNLTPIQEEPITSVEVDASLAEAKEPNCGDVNGAKENQLVDCDENEPPLKKKRKTQKYSKVPLWFVFSNSATARASKPYYQHLVSSWSPWSSAPDHELDSVKSHDKRQLLSVFLIN
ncbi:cyclin-G1-like [Symsagittifera roscoffensis]|uniref:cyclin-G1-like n=1 Tax=Symsagittifera roscoffensis TaxID=84072 RepID=UPI00307CC025